MNRNLAEMPTNLFSKFPSEGKCVSYEFVS